jgi:hypothetical protein
MAFLASQLAVLSMCLESGISLSLKHGAMGFAPSFRPAFRPVSTRGACSSLQMSGFGKQKESKGRKTGTKKADRQFSDGDSEVQSASVPVGGENMNAKKVDRPAALEKVVLPFSKKNCKHGYA